MSHALLAQLLRALLVGGCRTIVGVIRLVSRPLDKAGARLLLAACEDRDDHLPAAAVPRGALSAEPPHRGRG